MKTLRPLWFHDSQHPQTVKRRLLDSVAEGKLPARFLYDSPAQSARYLAYHRAWSPSVSVEAVRALYDRAYRAARPGLRWVGLGCGSGEKDARAHALNPRDELILVDTSPALVMEAMDRLPSATGQVADLTAQPTFGEAPSVYAAFGLLPNLDLLPWLAALVGEEDQLLLSTNLGTDRAEIVPQYDNAEARAWYRGALRELGIDAEISISATGGEDWSIQVHAQVDAELALFDAAVKVGRLELFRSRRFSSAAIHRALSEHFEIEAAFELEVEGVYLLRRSSHR